MLNQGNQVAYGATCTSVQIIHTTGALRGREVFLQAAKVSSYSKEGSQLHLAQQRCCREGHVHKELGYDSVKGYFFILKNTFQCFSRMLKS